MGLLPWARAGRPSRRSSGSLAQQHDPGRGPAVRGNPRDLEDQPVFQDVPREHQLSGLAPDDLGRGELNEVAVEAAYHGHLRPPLVHPGPTPDDVVVTLV